MSQKSWPILLGKLLYKLCQDFLDRQQENNKNEEFRIITLGVAEIDWTGHNFT